MDFVMSSEVDRFNENMKSYGLGKALENLAEKQIKVVEAVSNTGLQGTLTLTLKFKRAGDAGIAGFMLGKTHWEVTADAYWGTTDNQDDWLGAAGKVLYLYEVYNAAPDVTTVYYFEGTGLTRVQGVTEVSDDVIRRNVEFQGTGSLTAQTRSSAWPAQA